MTRKGADGVSAGVEGTAGAESTEDDATVNSYQLFYGAIKEQAEGLVKTNAIDAFCRPGAGFSD